MVLDQYNLGMRYSGSGPRPGGSEKTGGCLQQELVRGGSFIFEGRTEAIATKGTWRKGEAARGFLDGTASKAS